jgi:EmrB/QacA subfamily drug resistance transporter
VTSAAADRDTARVEADPRRWRLLVFVALGQFMVLLDTTVVALALPLIQRDLAARSTAIEWVVNAYVLVFGGVMLLGGRVADRWGRRRTLLAGVGMFVLASLFCGLAGSIGLLVTARALQGLGAAFLSPAALSVVTSTFPAGRERNTALGVWAALSGLGATLGVIAGGVVTNYLSWRWIFYINIPVGVLVVAGVLALAAADRPQRGGRPDLGGSVLITGGLTLLVWAMINVTDDGWTSAKVYVPFAGAVVLLVGFLLLEGRVSDPLVPLPIFSTRSMLSATAGRVCTAGVQAAVLFLGSFYLQRSMGYSVLRAGLAFLPLGVIAVAFTTLVPGLMHRLGPKALYAAGAAGSLASLAWLAWFPRHDGYLVYILPPLLLLGIAMQATTVPVNVVGVAEVPVEQHGIASGALVASFQIGTSLGIAAVASPALTHTRNALQSGVATSTAWSDGLRIGFAVAVVIAALNLVNAVLGFPHSQPAATRTEE